MKNTLSLCVLALLMAAFSNQCFAMMAIEFISRDSAKDLGIQIRATPSGPEAAVIALEFNPEKFKDFNCVYLDIREGEKFLMGYTPLKEKRTKEGTIVVGLTANREFLEKVTLTIVTGTSGLLDLVGHELRVKDFVDLKNLSDTPKKHAPAGNDAKDQSKGLPASPP